MLEKEFGYLRTAAAVPKIKIGDIDFNVSEINKLINQAEKEKVGLIIFPELSITGYTVGDLFHNNLLHKKVLSGIEKVVKNTKEKNLTVVVGAPLLISHKLINAAVVISKGEVLGIVPKINIPEYKEFYEKRWFSSGKSLNKDLYRILGKEVPVGDSLLFRSKEDHSVVLGIEICEDLWLPIPPSSYQALAGATIIANLSASNELVSKSIYRRKLVESQSARTISNYIYTSSGVHESTTDVVFSGHAIIASNGHIQKESERFNRESQLIISDVDVKNCLNDRIRTTSFGDMSREIQEREFSFIDSNLPLLEKVEKIDTPIAVNPFLPSNESDREEVVKEIFNIQVSGLAKRLEASGIKKIVLGLSGGLDSTLAFLVALKTLDKLKISRKNLYAITMPGFGTTNRTKSNAIKLSEATGCTLEEINIVPGATQQLKDIKHKGDEDVTYENVQARYRTMILMNKANQIGGLVLGTGDLSEIALGWCTFNGDHISNYNVNASVPKTLVKYIVDSVSTEFEDKTEKILRDILDTPISPELTGKNKKKVSQKTEEIIGPYELHDFFLYHFVRWNNEPKKILFLTKMIFKNKYSEIEIKKWLRVFIKRFFQNQWKRSVAPDGPKVGSVSLSPRGDWRMPSDAEVKMWLDELGDK